MPPPIARDPTAPPDPAQAELLKLCISLCSLAVLDRAEPVQQQPWETDEIQLEKEPVVPGTARHGTNAPLAQHRHTNT